MFIFGFDFIINTQQHYVEMGITPILRDHYPSASIALPFCRLLCASVDFGSCNLFHLVSFPPPAHRFNSSAARPRLLLVSRAIETAGTSAAFPDSRRARVASEGHAQRRRSARRPAGRNGHRSPAPEGRRTVRHGTGRDGTGRGGAGQGRPNTERP